MFHELGELQLPADEATERPARAVCDMLSRITGLTLHSAHEGTLAIGTALAEVTIEPSALHVRLFLDMAQELWTTFASTGELPTNMRYALVGRRLVVVSEAALEAATLAESLLQVATGLRMVLGKNPRAPSVANLTPAAVETLLHQIDLAPEDILRRQNAWQLHLRIADEAVPVLATLDGHDLVLSRKVIDLAADADACDTIARQALLLNAMLLHVRLAWRDAQVVAEVRVPASLLSAAAVMHHARGVAIAAQHAQGTLEILAQVAEAAAQFRRVFPQP